MVCRRACPQDMMISLIPENIYGHSKRLEWILASLEKDSTIIELGCGTGSMITIPLAVQGYQVLGIDMDNQSIAFGRELLSARGYSTSMLQQRDLRDVTFRPDVLIASEVLEHLRNSELDQVLLIIHEKIADDGLLLVTVPNGYGWFEMESFLWFKTGLGRLLERTRIAAAVSWFKSVLFRCSAEEPYPPSTLADSPHLQRFTFRSIQRLLKAHGFEILSATGSVLVAGPFSNLFFTGIAPVMKLNCVLGQLIPGLAAGFYIVCRPIRPSEP